MDVLEIDAASNTGVDNVRDAIIGSVAIAPARDRYKVFIIDEVHMLSGAGLQCAAENARRAAAARRLHHGDDRARTRCRRQFSSRCQQFRVSHDRHGEDCRTAAIDRRRGKGFDFR